MIGHQPAVSVWKNRQSYIRTAQKMTSLVSACTEQNIHNEALQQTHEPVVLVKWNCRQ